MENQKNRYMSVAYTLYVEDESGRHIVEKTAQDEPFSFISGFGVALDAFEQQVTPLEKGAAFEFSIPKEQAYGDYQQEQVLELEREAFVIDGRFDHQRVFRDAVIPLQNEEGTRFYGRVLEVTESKVRVDLNHPLAGETLYFKGEVLENREATEEETDQLVKQLTSGCCGCGGGCDNCEGECQS